MTNRNLTPEEHERRKAMMRARYWALRDLDRELSRQYYLKHKAEIAARQAAYRRANSEKVKEANYLYRKANPHIYTANAVKRKAYKLQRTPKWLTRDQLKAIHDIYKEARQVSKKHPEPCHVDHIVPLRGDTVSGLHVPWNLQILTGAENRRKKNHYE